MKQYEGYLKQKFGNEYLLLAGGQHTELSNFKTVASNWLSIPKYDDTNFNTFIDNVANLHNQSREELNLFRFYSENPQTYNLPCNDSLALIFSIDNSKDWIRALHFDVRTSNIYTINKIQGTWGNWSKIITSDNISQYIGSGTGFLPSVVTSNNATWDSGVAITDYGNAWAQRSMQIMCPNLTQGSASFICTGKANNTRNMGWMGFVYDGDGSASNRLSFGLYAVDNIISLMGNGYTYFNGFSYYINGAYYNGTSEMSNYVYCSSHIGSWRLSSDWDGTYFWLTGKYSGSTLPCAVSYASSCGGGGQALFSAGNIWISPARLQLLRYDATTYSDRCCVGVTNGNLHIDSYHGYDIYMNHYSSGNVRFGYQSSSYYVTSTGNMYMSNFYAYSDKRLKKNINKISNLLPIYSFDLKDSGKHSYGFIAQEEEKQFPELISDGEYKTVNYNATLSLYLAKLSNIVEENNNNMKAKIIELEQRLDKLESKKRGGPSKAFIIPIYKERRYIV